MPLCYHENDEKRGIALDSHGFRHALGQFATGIAVVFVVGPGGPHGMTINSFTSVSLHPPLILFCVDVRARTRTLIRGGSRFTVSILSQEQEAVSRLFADPATPDHLIRQLPTRSGIDGLPILSEALAYLDCSLENLYPAGDHDIVVGRVDDFGILRPGPPLLYFGGQYRRLIPPD